MLTFVDGSDGGGARRPHTLFVVPAKAGTHAAPASREHHRGFPGVDMGPRFRGDDNIGEGVRFSDRPAEGGGALREANKSQGRAAGNAKESQGARGEKAKESQPGAPPKAEESQRKPRKAKAPRFSQRASPSAAPSGPKRAFARFGCKARLLRAVVNPQPCVIRSSLEAGLSGPDTLYERRGNGGAGRGRRAAAIGGR